MAEAWQATCCKSDPKAVYSCLHSVASSPFYSLSPNFSNCSSLSESVSVFADYLRFYFFVSQPKALCSRARGYLSQLCRAKCPIEYHFFSALSSLALNISWLPQIFSSSATGSDKIAYFMLQHLPCSSMDFLLHNFNLSWSLHSLSSFWKTSIIPIHMIRKRLDSTASFQLISLTFCVSKLFECIIVSRLFFFMESNSIASPCHAGFCPGWSSLDQILHLS